MVVLRQSAAARQEAPDAAVQPREERRDVGVGRRRQAVEDGPGGWGRARVDAVEDERVEVNVGVQGAAEPLNRGDPSAAGVDQPLPGRTPPQPGEDGAQENAQHRARQLRVEGKLVAHRHRHGEDPLADGHVRQDAIDEVRGELAHPPAAAGRTEPAPFATEPDDGGVPAALTAHAQQAMLEEATPEIRLELAPDEGRQPPRPVLCGRAREERREVRRDGPVENGLLGLAASVGRRKGT